MRLAVSSYLTARTRLTTAWLERARTAGFHAVELFSHRESLDYRDRTQVSDLAQWFRDSELAAAALHTPPAVDIAEPDRMRRRAHCDELKRALEMLEAIPCRYVIQHFGLKDEFFHERRFDAAFASLEELNMFARDRGAAILLENGTGELAQPTRLAHFLAITHLPNGIAFDAGHAHIGEGIEPAWRILEKRVHAAKLHDNARRFDDHLAPGEGTIDWRRAMRLLRAHDNGSLTLTASVKDPGEWPDPLASVRDAMARLLDLDVRLTEEEARQAELEESRRER